MAYAVADPFQQAHRAGFALTYTVDARLDGVLVAEGLAPTGGTITDTTKPGVRRTLNLELAPEPGLFETLAPIGTQLTVTAHVRYQNQQSVHIPMGVFDVDQQSMNEGGGSLSLTAPDKWARVQRARFIGPGISYRNASVVQQISNMIRDALGPDEFVNITSSSTEAMTPMVWEKDRDKAINELAWSIGAQVFFDREGVATIADVPTAGPAADWLVDASASGVLVELLRERSRARTANVVVVSSSASEGELFPPVWVWDDDPASPTYAGTDPRYATDAGPFGVVPLYWDTPVISTAFAARLAGLTILARTTGLASQISLSQVPNPALDAFDVVDVLGPPERYDVARVVERHIVDTVTHPLTLGPPQRIDGRSTRTEVIEGGTS